MATSSSYVALPSRIQLLYKYQFLIIIVQVLISLLLFPHNVLFVYSYYFYY